MDKFIITKKLAQVGTSTGVVIEKPFLQQFGLKQGDNIKIILEKVKR